MACVEGYGFSANLPMLLKENAAEKEPAMFAALGSLSSVVATPASVASEATVVAACEHVRSLLGAAEAYVVRAGDPYFVRLGYDGNPGDYEIKQRGYWHAWRELAAGDSGIRLLGVRDRIVEEVLPGRACVPATHIAASLPGDESNSELLIVRGPWPLGISEEQVTLVQTIRPLMAYLVGNVLDGARQERLRSQMRVLAEVAEAFTQTEQSESALPALATALAKASGFAWVAILLFDANLEQVVERAINAGRHSNTEVAARGREGRESEHSGERDIMVARHMARTRRPYLAPDISDPAEQMLVNDELRPFYDRAHIVSMASFPVLVGEQMLGTITYCGSEKHAFGQEEVEFLQALVAQAAPTIKAFELTRELRQTENRLRAIFANAPVLITVFDPEGKILLLEGARLETVGQTAGSLVGQSVFDVMPRAFQAEMRTNLERGLRGETFDTIMQLSASDFQTQFAPLRDEKGEPSGVIAVTVDVSEQLQAQREMERLNEDLRAEKEKAEELARQAEESRRQAEYLASHDALTGVLSRRAWFDAIEMKRPSAIAIFDIDLFKTINDRYGHPAGDVVLREVADRLEAALEGRGVLGRLGGEEFGVSFDEPFGNAEWIARRAVECVAATPCALPGGESLKVTVSAGIAPCRRRGDDPQTAVAEAYELADGALYEAKEAGRQRLVVSDRAA